MQKKINFPLFRGSGGQIKFLIEKTRGEKYSVDLPFIHGWMVDTLRA